MGQAGSGTVAERMKKIGALWRKQQTAGTH
jgi:hypothetical protein